MGKGLIVKDGLAGSERAKRQTIGSAKDKSVLTDARTIDMNDPFGDLNQPRLVESTSANAPTDLNWGIREVFFKSSGTAVISITGTNKDGTPTVWYMPATKGSGNTINYGTWTAMTTYSTFVGATASANGKQGLVPKPLIANSDDALLADGSWGVPTSVVHRVEALADRVNQLQDVLNQLAEIINIGGEMGATTQPNLAQRMTSLENNLSGVSNDINTVSNQQVVTASKVSTLETEQAETQRRLENAGTHINTLQSALTQTAGILNKK